MCYKNMQCMTISELYTLYKQYPIVTTDSRICPQGAIFFALKGESFDGNAYAVKAIQAGCSFAVIDNASVQNDERMILVDDVLDTLQQLARLHRRTLGTTVIGITGTNGKTTTKELTSAVLSQKYNTLYTQGNLNNHIGVPLTLLRLTKEHDMAVIEMGANHPGEIRDLVNIAMPDYGLITNVGYAHLEGFGSFEGVIKTKGELYDYIRATKGKIFIDRKNKYLTKIAEGIEAITYGEKGNLMDKNDPEDAIPIERKAERETEQETEQKIERKTEQKAEAMTDSESFFSQYIPPYIKGETLDSHPYLSFLWQQNDGNTQQISTHLVGDYNMQNALAAISVGVYFNIPTEQINNAIESYEPTNNRSQLKKTANNTLIIDAYNANPSSMRAALENFAYSEASSKKAIILGDMRELGEKSHELHTDIVEMADKYNFDKVLLCGEIFSAVGQKHTCFKSVEELDKHLETSPLQGYDILIKGSRGIHLEKIIEKL